jgi:hypothetical protein
MGIRTGFGLALCLLVSPLPANGRPEPPSEPPIACVRDIRITDAAARTQTTNLDKASAEQKSQERARAEKTTQDRTAPDKAAAPFVVGEQINYDISWSNFIVAGELTLQTKERAQFYGRDAYHVTAEAQSVGIVKALNYRLNDQYESFVDSSSLAPFRGNKISHHGKKLVQSSFAIDPGGHTARLADGKSIEVPRDTYDMASVLFAIRGMSQTPGSSKTLNVIEDGKVYTIKVEPETREKAYTRAATYDAFRIAVKLIEDGKPTDAHKIRIYLTRDRQRLPVLITAEPPWGQIRIEMTGKLQVEG